MGNQSKKQQKAVQPVFNINEKGFIEILTNEGGVPRNMLKAYLQQASGKKTFKEAANANNLPDKITSINLSSKISTGLKRVLQATIFADQIAEKQAKIQAKAEKIQTAKIAKWEKIRRGRPPLGCNTTNIDSIINETTS